MPKYLDWCVLTRRDIPLSAAQRLFRSFVLEQGACFAECRVTPAD
jgi:LysR family transcriptional regulator, low CO2-responsive transcriptional regulator